MFLTKYATNAKAAAKTKTFWGGMILAVAVYLEQMQILPPWACKVLEVFGTSFGLYGARNTIKKVSQ